MHARPWTDLRALVLCYTAGVLAVHALAELPPSDWLLAGIAVSLWPWRGRWPTAALALGFASTVWQAQSMLDDRWPVQRHGEDHWVEGVVSSLPESDAQRAGMRNWRFLFAPKSREFPRRVRVAWYHAEEAVRGGDCWKLELRVRTPRGSLNPGTFDYEGWLFRQGIGATATVRDARRCTDGIAAVPLDLAGAASTAILRMRQSVADSVRAVLPGGPGRALLLALTVGDRSEFSDADWQRFRATGTSHLVAISGLHVGIVAGAVFFLFRWLWSASPALCIRLPAQRAGVLSAVLCAGAYAVLAGLQPPVLRALLMLWLAMGALWLNRFGEPSRVLALAWLAILLLDPFSVMAPGLWLSFAAVAAIFHVVSHRLRPAGAARVLVTVQLVLSLVLAPLTLVFFQGVSWVAPLANLVAVPVFTVLAPLALGSVAVHALLPAIGEPLLQLAALFLHAFHEGLGAAESAPRSWLPGAPSLATALLAMVGALILFAPRGLPLRALAILCFAPMLLAPARQKAADLQVTALDVGQGLAVVVQTPNHTLLYDAGPAWEGGFNAGASVVAPFLLSQRGRGLDLLFLSHGDNDHAGGAAAVRELLDVRAELGTANRAPCTAGMRWMWDGVWFEVLHPDGGGHSGNNASCVLKVSGPFTALLAGDIEREAEARLVRAHGDGLRADLLIAPHHGSNTSSTLPFVRAVDPELVLFSAGWRHHFGHPRAGVVARYEANGARGLTTAASGAIQVRAQERALTVSEHRREAPRFWNAAAEP